MEPVTTAEARNYMRIDPDDLSQDGLIAVLITAQREVMEQELSLSLVKRRVTENYRHACCGMIGPQAFRPKWSPVIGEVTFKDMSGNCIEVPNHGTEQYPLYHLTYSTDITYDSGYVILPEALKTALLQRVATAYENRENSSSEGMNKVVNHSAQLERAFSRNVF